MSNLDALSLPLRMRNFSASPLSSLHAAPDTRWTGPARPLQRARVWARSMRRPAAGAPGRARPQCPSSHSTVRVGRWHSWSARVYESEERVWSAAVQGGRRSRRRDAAARLGGSRPGVASAKQRASQGSALLSFADALARCQGCRVLDCCVRGAGCACVRACLLSFVCSVGAISRSEFGTTGLGCRH